MNPVMGDIKRMQGYRNMGRAVGAGPAMGVKKKVVSKSFPMSAINRAWNMVRGK